MDGQDARTLSEFAQPEGGGTPLLSARHRFLFEPEGKGTRVRSVETWEGPTERVMRHVVKPVAERLAGEQLAALKRAVEG